ncbi:MAG: tetratricopeptide repeat protein [Planctomycetaceae bacterium]
MKAGFQYPIAAAIVLSMATGCTTLENVPGKMKSLVSRAPDPTDPLANVVGKPGKDYKAAKKELHAPEETMLKFARWREDLGDHSESLERYREILRGNPDSVDARLGIARIEYKTGRVHEAEEILKATARQHPENQTVWLEMGRIQTEREEFGEAVQSLTKAVNIDSSSQAARYQLGLALARGDRLEEAKPHLEFAVGESAALFNIGFVLHEAGRNEEAIHWLQQALASHPDQRTEQSAQQMLALVRSGKTIDNAAVAAKKAPGKIDLQLTSYESYTENPARPATELSESAVAGRGAINGSADVGSALPGFSGVSQQSALPLLQRQAAATHSGNLSNTNTADPRFYNPPSPATTIPASTISATAAPANATPSSSGPPPWQAQVPPASFASPSFHPSAVPVNSAAVPDSPAGHQGPVEPQPWHRGGQY